MKTTTVLGILLLGSALSVTSRAATQGVEAVPEEGVELWFPIGETIQYQVLWGKVPVARSTAWSEWVEVDGRRLLAVRFETKSNKVIGTIYPVDDFIESLIDPETFLPVQFTKKLSEGRYRCHEITTFDHEKGIAILENVRRGTTKEYGIDPDTRDLVSFMYSMRTQRFPVGTEQAFRVMADEKLYDLTVKSLKEDTVKLKRFGKVASVVLEPEAEFQGLFVRKGKMRLWVSEDDRRIITKAAIEVPVANVNLVLDNVGGPGDDAWVNQDGEDEAPKKRTRRRRGKR